MTGLTPRWAKNRWDSESVRRVQAGRMTGKDQEHSKDLLLATALDHAWRWYDLRINSGLQILNFYLLAMTVLTAAYVSAFNSRNHVISVAVALAGAAVSASSYMAGVRQDQVARMALPSIEEAESRLAGALDINSLRLAEQYRVHRNLSAYAVSVVAHFVYPAIIIVCVVAGIYAAASK
jgi:hypothetical protein